MNVQTTQPLATYTKVPVPGQPTVSGGQPNASGSSAGFTTPAGKQPKKIFGMEARSLATVLGLTLFFVLAMAGVLIALRQRFAPEEVSAPNAPRSQPSAAATVGSCTLSFTVAALPSPTPEITPPPVASPTPSPTPTPNVTPSPQITPSPSPTIGCNDPCTSDSQCRDANSGYICAPLDGVDRCRADANRTSTTCETPKICNSPCTSNADCSSNHTCVTTPDGDRCRLPDYPTISSCVPPNQPPPPPTVGCNDRCSTNADCSNTAHVCAIIADGSQRCRLDSYPNSDTCSTPSVVTPPPAQPTQAPLAETPAQPQPELPAELPRTGAEDWGGFVIAGVGAVVVGALLLLFL